MPSKPYPREEAVALELESVAFTDPLFKNKKVSEFMDGSIIAELDRKGFFTPLQQRKWISNDAKRKGDVSFNLHVSHCQPFFRRPSPRGKRGICGRAAD